MKAYTLIELMVVITIVGILAAVSIPTFQNYLLRAKMGTARQYVDSFLQQERDYYSDHGSFPTNAALGVPNTIPSSAANYIYPPYVAYVTMVPQSTSGTQCPYTINTGHFSNYKGDFYADSISRYVVYYDYVIDHNGVMVSQCAYYEYDPSTSSNTTNIIFPDCINTNSPDTSAIMAYINSACT